MTTSLIPCRPTMATSFLSQSVRLLPRRPLSVLPRQPHSINVAKSLIFRHFLSFSSKQDQSRRSSENKKAPFDGNGEAKGQNVKGSSRRPLATLTLLASGGIATAVLGSMVSDPHQDNEQNHDVREPLSLPRYLLSEIKLHDGNSENPWITHNDKIYDITDWVLVHPGGDVILQAAGGPVEPYWDIFTIHKSQHVLDILEEYLVGYVHTDDLVDGKLPSTSIVNPFSRDPERHASLKTLTDTPRNAETPSEALEASFTTPSPLFYVRNHFWVPVVTAPKSHTLTIELPTGDTKIYTLKELQSKFPAHTITATLQCSGNRRSHMTKATKDTSGLPWTTGGISTATWTGIRLRDILEDAGYPVSSVLLGKQEPPEDSRHVHFSALEAYGASIPTATAIDPRGDVLLAYSMNGGELPRDHGFPLRVIVPGHVAARSVKWLNKITLSDEESPSQWQRKDYKSFGPNVVKPNWSTAPSIQEMPVTSAITSTRLSPPQSQPASPDNTKRQVTVNGYAFSGGGRAITRVDVSLDGGQSWTQANLLDGDSCPNTAVNVPGHGKSWAWKRWVITGDITLAEADDPEPSTTRGDLRAKERRGAWMCSEDIVVKATDEAYNTQPREQGEIWNKRGNLATAWHRVRACERCVGGGGNSAQGRG